MEPRTGSTPAQRPVISVHGTSTLRRAPELGTALITVEFDGDERAAVIERTLATQAEVTAGLGAHGSPAPGVVSWSAPQLRVWDERPWNQQGEVLPLVHHATSTISAVFDDRERLGAWLDTITGVSGVSVQQLEWSLTETSRLAAETEALGAAVSDARRRAEAIASALGLLSLRTIAVSDPGLLSDGDGAPISASDAAQPRMLKASASAPTSGQGIVLEPADLDIVIVVHARFVAE